MSKEILYEDGFDPNVDPEIAALHRYIICGCGKKLFIPDFTNDCECGRHYNWAGQELRPVSEWEETDEEY